MVSIEADRLAESAIAESSSGTCFHCGEPLPPHGRFMVSIEGEVRPMCCPAVAQAIVDHGLTDFYRHRTAPSRTPQFRTPDALVPEVLQRFRVYDNAALQKSFVRSDGNLREASLSSSMASTARKRLSL